MNFNALRTLNLTVSVLLDPHGEENLVARAETAACPDFVANAIRENFRSRRPELVWVREAPDNPIGPLVLLLKGHPIVHIAPFYSGIMPPENDPPAADVFFYGKSKEAKIFTAELFEAELQRMMNLRSIIKKLPPNDLDAILMDYKAQLLQAA